MEQEAKKRWFASGCCRQPYSSRYIGRDGVQQVQCSGCGRDVKKIYPVAAAPDRSSAILGEHSPDKDAFGHPKKDLTQNKDLEEDVPF